MALGFRAFVGVLVALFGALTFPIERSDAQTGPPGRLTLVRGGAGVVKGDGSRISPAYTGLEIGQGDRIGTFSRSDVRIDLSDGSRIELGSESGATFHDLRPGTGGLSIGVESFGPFVRHVVAHGTVTRNGYRLLFGQSDIVPQPARQAVVTSQSATASQGEALVAFAIGDRQTAAQQTFSGAPFAEVLVITMFNGTKIVLVLAGTAILEHKVQDPNTGASSIDGSVKLNVGQAFALDPNGVPPFGGDHIVDFDPNAPMDQIEARLLDAFDQLHQPVVNREVQARRNAEKKEDSDDKDGNGANNGQNGGGGGGGGGDNNAVTLNFVQRNLALKEPVSGFRQELIEIQLNKPTNVAVTFDFEFVEGTAKLIQDVIPEIAAKGSKTIPPGQTKAVIPFFVRGDGVTEGTETFRVKFSNPFNAVFDTEGFSSGGSTDWTISDP